MSTRPRTIGYTVAPIAWGAKIDYDAWTDPWRDKTEYVGHYGGGGNTAGEITGVWAEEAGEILARPRAFRHPWLWWKWRQSQEYLAQLAKERAVLRGWESYHLNKGWRGIAYNFAVGQSGTAYRLRGFNNNGAHYESDDIDHDGISSNSESIAVVFILGVGQEPSLHAWRSFKKLRRTLGYRTGVWPTVYGHKEIAASGGHSTACPGTPIMTRITRRWRTGS